MTTDPIRASLAEALAGLEPHRPVELEPIAPDPDARPPVNPAPYVEVRDRRLYVRRSTILPTGPAVITTSPATPGAAVTVSTSTHRPGVWWTACPCGYTAGPHDEQTARNLGGHHARRCPTATTKEPRP